MLGAGVVAEDAQLPRSSGISPASRRSMVDLPAPLGPSSAVTPGPRAKLTSDTATTSPNHFDTPVASTIGRGAIVAVDRAQVEGAGRHRGGGHLVTVRCW